MFAALGTRYYGGKQLSRSTKLVLDFLGGMTNAVLLTTRSGLATQIGPDGTTQWGPHNLVQESDTLISWGFAEPYYTPFAVPSFDGRMIGARFTGQGGALTTSRSNISVSDKTFSMSLDIQRGNFDTVASFGVGFYNQSAALDVAYLSINLGTMTLGLTGPQAASSITYKKDLGNGWFRIGITVTAGVSPGQLVYAYVGGVGGLIPLGNFWHVARVMVNNGTSMEYVNSTVANRFGYSNDFANAAWTKVAITPYPNMAVTSDGTPMTLLVETTALANHYILQSVAVGSSVSTNQFKIKPAGRTRIGLRSESPQNGQQLVVDLAGNGTVVSGPGSITYDPADGTYLVSCVSMGGTGASGYFLVEFYNGAGLTNYTGDGVSGIYIAQACVIPGTGVPTLGAERVTTTPSANNDWTASGTGGTKVAGGAAGSLYGSYGPFGVPYRMTVVVASVSGTLTPQLGSTLLTPITAPGTYTYDVTPVAGAYFYIDGTAATTATVTSVSVKPITYAPIPYSYNPGAAPSVGPIYGQRTDYDVSTVTGIGPELVTYSAWTDNSSAPSTITVNANSITLNTTSANAARASKSFATMAGKCYRMIVSNIGANTMQAYAATTLGGSDLLAAQNVASGVTSAFVFVATGSTSWINTYAANVATTVQISLQEAFAGSVAGLTDLVTGDSSTFAGSVGSWASSATWASTASAVGGELVLTPTVGYGRQVLPVTVDIGATYILSVTGRVISGSGYARAGMSNASNGASISTTAPTSLNNTTNVAQTGVAVFRANAPTMYVMLGDDNNQTGVVFGYKNVTLQKVTFANRGALIEPTQATQLLANPDDLSASPWVGGNATDDGTKFRGRRLWKIAKTTATASENRASNITAAISGNYVVKVAFLASSNSSQCDFGIWGGTSNWGITGNTGFTIESGPGAVSNMGGALWRITGLSTNVPIVVVFTRNFTVSETAQLNIFPDTYNSTTSGRAIYAQVDNLEAGTAPTSFIPNPASSGTVTRLADTSQVAFDDLARALPWLMDTNVLLAPEDLTNGAWTRASGALTPSANTISLPSFGAVVSQGVTMAAGVGAKATASIELSGSGTLYLGCYRSAGAAHEYSELPITLTATPTRYSVSLTIVNAGQTGFGIYVSRGPDGTATSVTANNAKLNPGPVAQMYYPQSSKQGTIVFEGDATFGSGAVSTSLVSLENGASNRVLHYFTTGGSFKGFVNANSATPGAITSGAVFKSVVGFSMSSAGTVLNGSAESAITASAFAAAPNVLKIGNDASGNAASSMHIRRLRIFSQNLPASTKQALTR